jgi:hypothetical protein
MQRLFRLIGLSTIALWLLGATNCAKNSDANAPQFVTTLTVQNSAGQPTVSFAQGDTVQFLLSIHNRSNQAQKLFFNSDEVLNLAVVDAGTATVIWTCDNSNTSSNTACVIGTSLGTPSSSGSGFNEIDFQPFETKTVTVTWDQTDDNGAQVPVVPTNPGTSTVGQYEVMGGFTVFNTTGAGSAADNGDSMAEGPPTAAQLFPSVYRSTLSAFTVN